MTIINIIFIVYGGVCYLARELIREGIIKLTGSTYFLGTSLLILFVGLFYFMKNLLPIIFILLSCSKPPTKLVVEPPAPPEQPHTVTPVVIFTPVYPQDGRDYHNLTVLVKTENRGVHYVTLYSSVNGKILANGKVTITEPYTVVLSVPDSFTALYVQSVFDGVVSPVRRIAAAGYNLVIIIE